MGYTLYDKAYFNYLSESSVDMQEFIDEFPKMEYANFLNLTAGILSDIDIEIKKYTDGLTVEEQEELNDFSEYLLLLEKKRYTLNKRKEYMDIIQEQEANLEETYRNIIFATTPSGNVCLEQDLKDIDLENYDKFLEALTRLRNNDRNFSSEKQKPMVGKNVCRGLYEIKAFQFRLIYMIVNKDTVLAIMAEDKIKDTSSKKKTRQPAQRKELVESQVKYYQELLKNEDEKEKIIAQNDAIYDELVDILSKGRRVK